MNGLHQVLKSLLKEGVMNYDTLSSVSGLTVSYCQKHAEQLLQQGMVRIMPFGGSQKKDVVIMLTPVGKETAARLNSEIRQPGEAYQ
ncbi:hypothetical protein GCM10023189_10930 [Nibrella saemangeumensis]|uniref:Winged helix DNA-binding domain-containing protein n=1 Tax=Nibrella saemangeumensis TaxID=1084526 RepID=A0ABP8MKQ9_9BACT